MAMSSSSGIPNGIHTGGLGIHTGGLERRLVMCLLQRLGDDDVHTRLRAARLFAGTDPTFVVR